MRRGGEKAAARGESKRGEEKSNINAQAGSESHSSALGSSPTREFLYRVRRPGREDAYKLGTGHLAATQGKPN
jgi:hypothetical protein